MRWVWPLVCLTAMACASAPPPPVAKPAYKDGVLQRKLGPKDAERALRQAVPKFDVCYRREQMNLAADVSSYMFQIFWPSDGTTPDVEVLKETVRGQLALRSCLVEAIESAKLPAHLGDPITLKVPIEGQ